MTTDNFCFYLQNRLIQTSQTGGQQYSVTFPEVRESDESVKNYIKLVLVKRLDIQHNDTQHNDT